MLSRLASVSGRLSEGYTSALGDLGKLGLKVAASDLAKASPTSTILGLPPFRRSAVDVCAWRAPVHEPCRVMQGHTLADRILDDVKRRAEAVEQRRRGNWPTLAIVLAAPQAASQKYVRVKDKTARCLGIETRVVEITGEETRAASAAAPPAVAPADVSAADGSSSSSSSRADNLRDEDVLRVVRSLNEDPSVDGIIVQLPLPAQLNTHAILQAVAPHKDVDGFHLENQARLLLPPQELGALAPDYATSLRNSFMRGMPTVQPASWVPAPGSSAGSSAGNSAGNSFGGSAANSAGSPPAVGNVGAGRAVGLYPCTPLAVMALLGEYGVRLEGSHVVLLGRSIVVGQPLALMLANEGAATTCLDARSSDDTIARSLAGADVVISATGRAGSVTASMLREGVVVVDVGINFVPLEGTDAAPEPSSFEDSMRAMDEKIVLRGIPKRRYDCVDGDGEEKARNLKMVGDVDAFSVRRRARLLTPVPGGVGPLTVAMLMRNVVVAAECAAQG